MLTKNDTLQPLNKANEKKNHRFVVTEFVKTCDELVIGRGSRPLLIDYQRPSQCLQFYLLDPQIDI